MVNIRTSDPKIVQAIKLKPCELDLGKRSEFINDAIRKATKELSNQVSDLRSQVENFIHTNKLS